jgi:D-alanine-D-alanine ligase
MNLLKRPLRIVALVHQDLMPPDSIEGLTEKQILPFKMEYDVKQTLQQLGHEVRVVGLYSDLGVIGRALEEFKPDIVFNMLEEFDGQVLFDQHVVSYLELNKVPYTGCNPRGLTLSHDKGLSKEILAYHRVPVPAFAVFRAGRKPRRPAWLKFPLLVKSLIDEGSVGIARTSVVHDDEAFTERVELTHRQTGGSPAIAEQYIAGREIYVSVMGSDRLQVFPPWELLLHHLPEGAPNIATSRLKWDHVHQVRLGLETRPAELSAEERRHLDRLSRRIYRALHLSGYARLDFRLSPNGQFFLLEANPNPNIAHGEDFAASAEHSGVGYQQLLDRIVRDGLRYRPRM